MNLHSLHRRASRTGWVSDPPPPPESWRSHHRLDRSTRRRRGGDETVRLSTGGGSRRDGASGVPLPPRSFSLSASFRTMIASLKEEILSRSLSAQASPAERFSLIISMRSARSTVHTGHSCTVFDAKSTSTSQWWHATWLVLFQFSAGTKQSIHAPSTCMKVLTGPNALVSTCGELKKKNDMKGLLPTSTWLQAGVCCHRLMRVCPHGLDGARRRMLPPHTPPANDSCWPVSSLGSPREEHPQRPSQRHHSAYLR